MEGQCMTAGSGSCTRHDGVMQGHEIKESMGIQPSRMDSWKRLYTRVVRTLIGSSFGAHTLTWAGDAGQH